MSCDMRFRRDSITVLAVVSFSLSTVQCLCAQEFGCVGRTVRAPGQGQGQGRSRGQCVGEGECKSVGVNVRSRVDGDGDDLCTW